MMDKRDYMKLAQKNIEDIKRQLEHIDFMYSRSFFDDDSAHEVYESSEEIVINCESIQEIMGAIEELYNAIE